MLTIAPLASGQAGYYLSLTATSYYTEAPEPMGYWYGEGAQEFGLSGDVRPEDLVQLCRGYDPKDPTKHVRNAEVDDPEKVKNQGVPRKHGDDLCFSAPKSVSVAWALAGDELRAAIEKAMHQAVKDALDYVQDACGYARVGAQGQELSRVPLTFALFEHSSSRAGDPQLHVHALAVNLTKHHDGRVTAIDSTNFYHAMMAGGALFRASLSEGMRRLGFDIERDGSAFRLKGFDEEVCERFSQRRAEIVEEILKRSKVIGKLSYLDSREVLHAARGRMAELINLDTRSDKKEYTRHELLGAWQDIARSMGISTGYVENLLGRAEALTPDQKHAARREVFKETVKVLEESYSHFAERDVTRKLAEEAQGKGLNARDVRELVQAKIAGNDFLKLGELVTEQKNHERKSFRKRTEERFTTEEILKMEGLMLGAVERMAQKDAPIERKFAEAAIEKTAQKLAAAGHKFTEEQAQAVRLLTTGKGLIACMTGKAGTGKSTTLETCREAWEEAGRVVLGCALQGSAADELQRTAGIKSGTLASTLYRLEDGRLTLTPRHVVVLDEAGMVPSKLMAKLIHEVDKAGAKIVAAGDGDQLQPIGAGGPFRSISERLGPGGHCVLTKIIRQREEWRQKTVEQFSRGEAREALIAYAARKQLHVTKTRQEAISGLVERWRADNGVNSPKDVLLLASLNAEVRAINRLCQEGRREAGKLKEMKLLVGGDAIFEGDRVMLGKNHAKLDVKNGFSGEVVRIDETSKTLVVRLDKDDREVAISVEAYGAKNIRLGYATTVHKSQGRSVEHCHVLMGGHMDDLHLGYVQASRCRESTHLFIDQAHAGPKMADAIRSLARSRAKDLAHDVIDPAPQRARELDQAEAQRQHRHGLSRGL